MQGCGGEESAYAGVWRGGVSRSECRESVN